MGIKNTPESWDELALEAGSSWEAAMWSEGSQASRFARIAEWVDELAPQRAGLLDWGCGTAGLFGHLPERVDYFGHDWSPAMRERAARENPGATILDELVPTTYDFVVCCGPFNLSHNWSKHDTYEKLRELWEATGRALIVSLYRGQWKHDMLTYDAADCVRLLELLGYPSWSLTTEHLPNDILVRFVRRA